MIILTLRSIKGFDLLDYLELTYRPTNQIKEETIKY